jgi:radical SAM superfamily enzyme YgiQ (UPF0313 family)
MFVLAAATPRVVGDPILVDESLEPIVPESIQAGDIVGISVHTGNALRGYQVGQMARARGAWVIYGGIHATLYPEEVLERGAAHAVVKGDGDIAWGKAVTDCLAGKLQSIYEGGRIGGDQFLEARWDLMPPDKYMWASVQTIRGCPKHCSFCSVWRTDGQQPRQRQYQKVIDEIVSLRRIGFRFIALADDNFYPVTLTDLRLAQEQNNLARLEELTAIRAERFQLMAEMAKLPKNMVFFTQITMEAAEDDEYLDAMHKANIKGALVGVEAVTPEGLKAVYKDWNCSGDELVKQLKKFREHGVHVLGSFIFGLPSDKPSTFDATAEMALKTGITFAQMGKGASHESNGGGRCADYTVLADSTGCSSQDVYSPPFDEFRRDSSADTKGLGQLLSLGSHLEEVGLYAESAREACFYLSFQALPADVCGHGHLDG